MRERLGLTLVAAVLAAGACSPSTKTAAPSEPGASTGATVTSPIASPTAASIQLTGSTYAATPGKSGGSVVLAEMQYPGTVNPYYALSGVDLEVAASMFDGLLTVTPDLRYAPDLATNVPTLHNGGVTLNGSGMDVTFNLKPGMEWSDGQPITCDDVKATWLWNVDLANTALAQVRGTVGWQDISGIDGGTGTTCVIHYSKVYEGYLSLMSPVLPAHYISTVAVQDAPTKLYPLSRLSSGVYSGPYIPVSASAKAPAQITLMPNPNWSTIGGHAPWLSSVTWRFYGDAGKMIAGFRAGDYDVGQGLSSPDIPLLAGVDTSRQVVHDSLTYELLAFNTKSLKDKFGADYTTIIEAIKRATDRPAIATGPLAGNVAVSNDFISRLAWYYKPVGGSTTADPTSASTLLANARWAKNADGYLSKAGQLLELTYCTDTRQFRVDTLKLVTSQLGAIGIKVDVATKSDADVFGLWSATKPDTQCNLRHGNFDVAEFSLQSPPIDPLPGYFRYRSDEIPDNPPNTGANVTRISLAALDQAYGRVISSVDFNQVRDAMFAIQDIYGSDKNTYELPLYFRKDIWLVNARLHNFAGGPTTAGGSWNMGDWWVD
jgi:peptide/nickel transport system substrate-binding protein